MRLSDFDYILPKELIAQYPSPVRDMSRLMVLNRADGSIEHRLFKDITDYLKSGDVLVINETKVLPARLNGYRDRTGGRVELLLINSGSQKIENFWGAHEVERHRWNVLIDRKTTKGETIIFGDGKLRGRIIHKDGKTDGSGAGRKIEFSGNGNVRQILAEIGVPPLPPYIKRTPTEIDRERYQTVYAKNDGSLAAPTAGLHFTDELINDLKSYGIEIVSITLHIGTGTFTPVRADDIRKHKMNEEYFEISEKTAKIINNAKKDGRRIIAVGTTVTRALESAAQKTGYLRATKGFTSLFIYPGYPFKIIDGLITNFHLPGSTLIMLVSAFAGRENILEAYAEAVRMQYRFYSYGDAMLIL
ncbi:MAG: tRNA preQ1(34) S-adenosylmethionine ribosyltransferase-isomerase QueA [Nitrospirota bacterium]